MNEETNCLHLAWAGHIWFVNQLLPILDCSPPLFNRDVEADYRRVIERLTQTVLHALADPNTQLSGELLRLIGEQRARTPVVPTPAVASSDSAFPGPEECEC